MIPEFIFQDCNSMFALELPEHAREINGTLIEFEFGALCFVIVYVTLPFHSMLNLAIKSLLTKCVTQMPSIVS